MEEIMSVAPVLRETAPGDNPSTRLWKVEQKATGDRPLTRSAVVVLLAYLVAIFAAELLTVWKPATGMIFHIMLLVLMLTHAALARNRASQRVLLALALAPLIRILSLAMPLGGFPQMWWYFIISVPLFAATAIVARLLAVQRRDLGLVFTVSPAQWLIMSLGIPLGILEYVILRPGPLASAFTWRQLWLPVLILLVSTGFLEELVFRGLLQHVAVRALGTGGGIVFVSALFAILHIGHRSVLDTSFVFLAALFFAVVAQRTKSILGVTIAHGLTNVMLFLICPFFLVS